MPNTMSKARQAAEQAFSKEQSQFIERTRAFREQDADASDLAEKTRRLRKVRLEREEAGRTSASFKI